MKFSFYDFRVEDRLNNSFGIFIDNETQFEIQSALNSSSNKNQFFGCKCTGKCVKKCPCKKNGINCNSSCQCKISKCKNSHGEVGTSGVQTC